jgi:glucose-1-phosphate cytidylyltransferase
MKHYSHFGFNEFVIALGYKGDYITNWMLEYFGSKNVNVEKINGSVIIQDFKQSHNSWCVSLVETGPDTQTGGRIKRLTPWLNNQTFMLTWCDAVANIDLDALLTFHNSHGRLATVTAVQPPSRFGRLIIDGNKVTQFKEKPRDSGDWINGAFFVLEPDVLNYIEGDSSSWEKESLEKLAGEGELMAFQHKGFWQCMDTIHENRQLEKMWQSGNAPWKIWNS